MQTVTLRHEAALVIVRAAKEGKITVLNCLKVMKRLIIKSPLAGKVVSLEDVPDEVFACKLVGDGVAIDPSNKWLVSPVEGTIVNISSAQHAIGIKARNKLEILIHLGIDTVELKGHGFKALVEIGQKIKPGEKLMEIDWDYIRGKVPAIISPVIITNMENVESIRVIRTGSIQLGEDLLSVRLKKGATAPRRREVKK